MLSDLKARDTLARMQRAPDTVLDRAIASEIAIRDGARAVILPTVAEVGGRVRVSAEVIDPRTQTTVYAESADGKGVDSTLGSIDKVTAALRGKLGEAVKSIEQDSAPLPQVTTTNLDALRAYALGQKAYGQGNYVDALQFYERATELDPQFALAWIGQVRVRNAQGDASAAMTPLRQAQVLRDRLAQREKLYLDAWAARFDAPATAPGKWREAARLYPDFWPAQANASHDLYVDNRFEEALPFGRASLAPQNPNAPISHDWVGRSELGLEQYGPAAKSFDRAGELGYISSLRRRVMVDAAQRNFAAARRLTDKMSAKDHLAYLEQTSVAVDQAQWARARTLARSGLDLAKKHGGIDSRYFPLPMAVTEWLGGSQEDALQIASDAAEQSLQALEQKFDADAVDDAATALAAALLAQRLGDRSLPERVLARVEKHSAVMAVPRLTEWATVVRANQLRSAGRAKEALEALKPLITGHERYQTRAALMEAYADAGNNAAALEQARWLQRRRGLAYVELECGHCLQALNVADSNLATLREAELLNQSGNSSGAKKALESFDRRWPAEALPDHLRKRREAASTVSNWGGV